MSDYIKREDAVERVAFEIMYEASIAMNLSYQELLELEAEKQERIKMYIQKWLEQVPSADVVEVVRKPVKGYEGHYEVDQFGRVYSVSRVIHIVDNSREYDKPIAERQLRQSLHTKGYKVVALTLDGVTKTQFVHRLVAEAFIENPDNLPMVNHKDEDKTNNFVDNLEWCTAEYNTNYGNARRKQAKKLKGRPHTEEHKKKISESLKA